MKKRNRRGKRKEVREIVVRKRMDAECGKPVPEATAAAMRMMNGGQSKPPEYLHTGGKSPILFLLEKLAWATHNLMEVDINGRNASPTVVAQTLDSAFYQVQRFRNYHEFSATALRFENGEQAIDAYMNEHAPESDWGRFKRWLFLPVLKRFAAWLYDDVVKTTRIAHPPSSGGWFAP